MGRRFHRHGTTSKYTGGTRVLFHGGTPIGCSAGITSAAALELAREHKEAALTHGTASISRQ